MKAIKRIPLVSLFVLVVFCGTQTTKARIAHAPLGLIHFSYIEETEDDPFVFIPFDGRAIGITATVEEFLFFILLGSRRGIN